jgi:hypothetical protein
MSEGFGAEQDDLHGSNQENRDKFLNFFKRLQSVSNKIHSTSNVDQIMLDLSQDICDLFGCDRLTIYALSESKITIESKVKTGLNSFKDFKLPISDKSVAGFVAMSRKMVCIRDVYDESELKSYAPGLQFLRKVDQRTGYRTREMLANPLINSKTGELLGVVQIINNRDGGPFSVIVEEGLKELCTTLAIAFAQRLKAPTEIRTKYDYLVTDKILSIPELELARRAARRKRVDLEDVLINEFKIKLTDIGASLSKFFGVPYEPFQTQREKPAELLKNFRREYVEHNQWLLLEQGQDGLVVLTTDPDRVEGSRIVHNLFPKTNISFHVTSNAEFRQTLDQFFGVPVETSSSIEKAVESNAEKGAEIFEPDHATAIEDALLKRVEKLIADDFHQGSSDIRIEVGKDQDKCVSRLRDDGSLESVSGQFIIDYRIEFP